MGNDRIAIKYLDQLPDILNKYGIPKEDICIVGSSVLSAWGIRENRDLDIVIKPQRRKLLVQQYHDVLNIFPSGIIFFSDDIQSVFERYKRVGISDEEMINKPEYHFLFDGWKIARIEIILAYKTKRNGSSDITDIKNLENLLAPNSGFDWDFFRRCLSASVSPGKFRGSFLSRFAGKVLRFIKLLLLNPKKAFSKFKNIIRKQIEHTSLSISLCSELSAITNFMISTTTLLGMQFRDEKFNRYDVIMRYLTIDKIEKRVDNPFDGYNVMQKLRGNHDTADNFLELIASIKNNGFSTKYPVPIDLKANIADGSHRLACALYYNIDKIPYMVLKSDNSHVQYGLDWFHENGFDETALIELEKTKKKLFLQKGIYFCATIWGTAEKYFDDISNDIGSLYKIIYQEDLFLGDNYGRFIDDIYAIDDMSDWKITTKKQLICQSLPKIRLVLFEMPNPNFIIKQRVATYVSLKGAALKKIIRGKYSSKIPNYFYDTIIHTGDNYEHNEKILKATQKYADFDIDKVLSV